MIQPTEGAGSSGITAKAGKQASTGLFAKLMAILDKHALQGVKSAAGKNAAISGTPEATFANKVRSTPHNEGLAHNKGQDINGATAPAVWQLVPAAAVHAKGDIAPKSGSNVLAGKGKEGSALFSAQPAQAHITNKLNTTGKPALESIATVETPASAKTSASAIPAGLKPSHPTSAIQADSTTSGSKTAASTTPINLIAPEAAQKDVPVLTRLPVSKEAAANQQSLAREGAQASVKLTAKAADTLHNIQTAAHESIAVPVQQAMEKNPARAQLSGGNGSKAELATHAAQTAGVAIATPGAQAQHIHAATQQTGNQPSAVAASMSASIAQAGSDSANADTSGQQSSDKGSQDGRTLIGSLDSRGSTQAASSTANFSSYLSQKADAGVNIFEGMQLIAQSARDGKTKIEIQLEPANLGKIHVSLQTDAAKQLQVHLIADQGSTRQLIEQQMPALRHALAQQGLDLSGFSLGSRNEGQHFDSQQRQANRSESDVNELTISDTSTNRLPEQRQFHAPGSLSIRV